MPDPTPEKNIEQIALAAIDEIRVMQNQLTLLTHRLATLLPQGPRPPRKRSEIIINGKPRKF